MSCHGTGLSALTHTGDLFLIQNLELLVNVFEAPCDFGEEHILNGSRTALGSHIFAHQPPQIQRAHGSHHQRLEQRAIVPGTIARFGRWIDRLFRHARSDSASKFRWSMIQREPATTKSEMRIELRTWL